MALQLSDALRSAGLDAYETATGTSAILKIRSGTVPANTAASEAGTTALAVLNLPSDWLAAASAGVKSKSGTWEDTSADASGTATFFRIYASDGTTCHWQGTVSVTGGAGDLQVDNVSINAGQTVTITSFTITAGNS